MADTANSRNGERKSKTTPTATTVPRAARAKKIAVNRTTARAVKQRADKLTAGKVAGTLFTNSAILAGNTDAANLLRDEWTKSEFDPPIVLFANFRNIVFLTISDGVDRPASINTFVGIDPSRLGVVYAAVKSKCRIETRGGVQFYVITQSDMDVEDSRVPIIPIGCTNNSTNTARENFAVSKLTTAMGII